MMPALFIGHGSPMNALANNSYTRSLNKLGRTLVRPKAILVISAHWQTHGTKVLKAHPPKAIYDFYGFPDELYEVKYDAPGSDEAADEIANLLHTPTDSTWGLDHGTWSILVHLFPEADIPVLQLSLNRNFNMAEHLALGRELQVLRERGFLLIGSGNITHNLREIKWGDEESPFDWAIAFDESVKKNLLDGDVNALLAPKDAALFKQAHPTIEHYLPLLYTAGATTGTEVPAFPFEGIQNGSLSMRSVLYPGNKS